MTSDDSLIYRSYFYRFSSQVVHTGSWIRAKPIDLWPIDKRIIGSHNQHRIQRKHNKLNLLQDTGVDIISDNNENDDDIQTTAPNRNCNLSAWHRSYLRSDQRCEIVAHTINSDCPLKLQKKNGKRDYDILNCFPWPFHTCLLGHQLCSWQQQYCPKTDYQKSYQIHQLYPLKIWFWCNEIILRFKTRRPRVGPEHLYYVCLSVCVSVCHTYGQRQGCRKWRDRKSVV